MIRVEHWIPQIPEEERTIAYRGEHEAVRREFFLPELAYADYGFHLDMAFDLSTVTDYQQRQRQTSNQTVQEQIGAESASATTAKTVESYSITEKTVDCTTPTDIAPLEKEVRADGIHLFWTVLSQQTRLPGMLRATLRGVSSNGIIKKSAEMFFLVEPAVEAEPAAELPRSEFEQMEQQMDTRMNTFYATVHQQAEDIDETAAAVEKTAAGAKEAATSAEAGAAQAALSAARAEGERREAESAADNSLLSQAAAESAATRAEEAARRAEAIADIPEELEGLLALPIKGGEPEGSLILNHTDGNAIGTNAFVITDFSRAQDENGGYTVTVGLDTPLSAALTEDDRVCFDGTLNYDGLEIDPAASTLSSVVILHAPADMELYPGVDNHLWIVGKPEEGTHPFGKYATAAGRANRAAGVGSFVEGYQNTALNKYAHTEGRDNKSGYGAHAEGIQNKAFGTFSHVEGIQNQTDAPYSHAEGKNTAVKTSGAFDETAEIKDNRYIIGSFAHAEGLQCATQDTAAHAEGFKSWANGFAAHAEGSNTRADNHGAHAEGNGSQASGVHSHAEGKDTIAAGEGCHAEGNGTQAKNRYSHAEGSGTKATGFVAHAEGSNTEATGDFSHAEGESNKATGARSHVGGYNSTAGGVSSFAFGNWASAHGNCSTAFGIGVGAHGECTSVLGKNLIASSKAEGQCVVGGYNKQDDNARFIVGTGSANGNANGFTVRTDGSAEVGKMGEADLSVATKAYVDAHSGGAGEGEFSLIASGNGSGSSALNIYPGKTYRRLFLTMNFIGRIEEPHCLRISAGGLILAVTAEKYVATSDGTKAYFYALFERLPGTFSTGGFYRVSYSQPVYIGQGGDGTMMQWPGTSSIFPLASIRDIKIEGVDYNGRLPAGATWNIPASASYALYGLE